MKIFNMLVTEVTERGPIDHRLSYVSSKYDTVIERLENKYPDYIQIELLSVEDY